MRAMSLRAKMVLGIGVILLVVMLAYAILISSTRESRLIDRTRSEAELIAAVTERAIARAMTAGKSEEVQAILEEIGEVSHLAAIRIVDPQGTVLRSASAQEAGQILAERERPPGGRRAEAIWDHRARTVGIFRPIPNRPTCHGCHPQDQTTLGFLNVRLASPGAESREARQWMGVILSAAIALIAAGGLIAGYFALVVGRRIDGIARTMGQVEAGDLTAKVPEANADELGRLGKSFNVMVARLAEAQRQVEDRHAEQIRRAEHLAFLGKMAAGIAHEINNPLAGMQNCARTLLRGVRDDAQRVQYLEMIQEGLGRIGRTVRQLLDFARDDRPQVTRTQLTPLADRCLRLLAHELADRRISCSPRLDPGLPAVLADPHQLEQVLLNVLMNALEAMPKGGSLTVCTGVRDRETGLCVEVRVSDTGGGIPREHLHRIFDPFFTTKDPGQGTGLGLSVSYGIVQAHGGVIDVDSELGKGTTFTIALPVGGRGGSNAGPGPGG